MNDKINIYLNDLIINYLAIQGIFNIKSLINEKNSIYNIFNKISMNNKNIYIDLLNNKNILSDTNIMDEELENIIIDSYILYNNINIFKYVNINTNNYIDILSIIIDDEKMYEETINNILLNFKNALKYIVYNNNIRTNKLLNININLLYEDMLYYVDIEDYINANNIKNKIFEIKKGLA
jgi:hypothetical protein